jgi:hypothetical protein
MKTITVLKTPKVSISQENFIYNYYSEKEESINDKKFIVFEGEEDYYSIRTIDAREITEPRFVTFNLDLSSIEQYNLFETINGNINLAGLPAVVNQLQKISNFGSSLDNLFDKNKRKKYFNDITFLKQNQISDNEIDLTLPEDSSEPYRQLVSFYDEEDPELVIPTSENSRYINSSNRSKEGEFSLFKQRQKNGDSTIIDRSIFRRIKNSNKKIIYSYLEDKQSESNKNFGTILKQNGIGTLQESVEDFIQDLNQNEIEITNRIFDAARNPGNFILGLGNILNDEIPEIPEISEENLGIVLRSANLSRKQIFKTNPKILIRTLDNLEGEGNNFRELNEFVVGILIDKYRLENNNKKYLCSRFISGLKQSSYELKDLAVNYGKTYIYEVRPVLLQSFVDAPEDTGIPARIFYLILGNRTSSYAIKCVERESPLPPSHLELYYNQNQKGIELKWGIPANRQRDITNFQVFRRESPFEPFKLVKEYRKKDVNVVDNSDSGTETPENTLIEKTDFMKFNYLDKNIKNNKIYIYAVCCVDAHGLSSAYSAQVAGRFNGLTSRLEVDTISLAGALKQYPNQLFPRKTKFYNFENDVISNTPIIRNKSKMNIYFTPDYQTIDKGSEKISIFDPNLLNYFSISLTDMNTLSTSRQNIYIRNREA